MKWHFHGAAQTTTGSRHVLETNGTRLMVECGMYQGKRDESTARNSQFPFDPRQLHAMALSHAHIDHSGAIPTLVKLGFSGNIYATHATRDLSSVMLQDSAAVQRADAAFVSKKRAKKGLPPVQALYTEAEAAMAVRQFVAVGYDRTMPVADNIETTFRDAGHILGSSEIYLDVRENGARRRIAFSGDLGRGGHPLLRDPRPVEDADVLIIESTYGNREHEPMTNINERLCAIINRALERRGKVIIPSFAVGRTQHMVYALHQLVESKCIPALPMFVDSPLAVNATEIFRLHPECFNTETFEFLRAGQNPFGMNNLTYIRDVQQSMALNDLKEPCIILSASGMAEAGRIRHHLKNNIGDERNTILMVGFCAEHTLGARLIAGDKVVRIFGEEQDVKAHVEVMSAFSAHADRSELHDFARKATGPLRDICVVHGEPDQSNALGAALREMFPKARVHVPALNDCIEF
ncbi:MAG: MBL fold metallo-hydrolase [Verrucomicrobia bacterium]|nr:MBL fold metallo-hydrolase [Verrucomicrobiota bacterium]